jgi:hypothetical protein
VTVLNSNYPNPDAINFVVSTWMAPFVPLLMSKPQAIDSRAMSQGSNPYADLNLNTDKMTDVSHL